MFLVKDRRLGMDNHVFTRTDPRLDGFNGDVTDNVMLDYDMNQIHLWPEGDPRPEPRLGQDPQNERHFKVFRSPEELETTGYKLVNVNTPFVASSWSDYRRQYYPVPEEFAKKMTQDEWFDYLEEADAATKFRKKMTILPDPEPGSTRDQIAEWVAKRHMSVDGGIRQVWYLRTGSPEDEIRLLEVSEQYTSDTSEIEPVDFGLDIGGAKFKLFVADISGEQLSTIKANPAKLPKDWKLDSAMSWGRRA